MSCFLFTALSTWFCLSPSTTMLVIAPLSLLYIAFYCIANSYRDVKTNDAMDIGLDEVEDEKTSLINKKEDVTWKTKLSAFYVLLVYATGPNFFGFFAEYLILQSIVTTLAYHNAPFSPRDHFQYYSIAVRLGSFFGRSHRWMLSAIHHKCVYEVKAAFLWILALIEVGHMVLLLCESWFRFFDRVEITIFVCFTSGIIAGLLFSNTLEILSTKLNDEQRRFGMATNSFPATMGILCACLMGFWLERQLKQHCMKTVVNDIYCFTRSPSVQNITINCRI